MELYWFIYNYFQPPWSSNICSLWTNALTNISLSICQYDCFLKNLKYTPKEVIPRKCTSLNLQSKWRKFINNYLRFNSIISMHSYEIYESVLYWNSKLSISHPLFICKKDKHFNNKINKQLVYVRVRIFIRLRMCKSVSIQ